MAYYEHVGGAHDPDESRMGQGNLYRVKDI